MSHAAKAPDRAAIDRGHDLERGCMAALGCLPGVVVHRNAVMRVRLPSGGVAWTGLGGEGAPDLLVEVQGPDGAFVAVWLECKSGDSARLSKAQRAWHAAAARMGRHVYVARSVEHALAIVAAFSRGEVAGG